MKVLFLGTGAAEGIPALFCDCAICSEARRRRGPNLRTRTSILIDRALKIDFPPDSLAHVHAYGLNFADLRQLLVTHSHDDHLAPREFQYLAPTFAPGRSGALKVYGASGLRDKIDPEMRDFFEQPRIEYNELTPFETVLIDGYDVTSILANHKDDEVCLNYLITEVANGRTLLYATDTGWYGPETWAFLATVRIDAAILECGKGVSDSTYSGHLNLGEAVSLRQRLLDLGAMTPDASCYLTHISHTGLMLHEELSAIAATHGLKVAYDGLEIDV